MRRIGRPVIVFLQSNYVRDEFEAFAMHASSTSFHQHAFQQKDKYSGSFLLFQT
jgi:hypothetical protein